GSFRRSRPFQPQLAFGAKIECVKFPVDIHRATQQARAVRLACKLADRLQCAYEDGGGITLALGYNVETMVHAIDEVDIGKARRTEHHRIAWSFSSGSVAGAVFWAAIGFGLHDAPRAEWLARDLAHEQRANQVTGHRNGIACKKIASDDATGRC